MLREARQARALIFDSSRRYTMLSRLAEIIVHERSDGDIMWKQIYLNDLSNDCPSGITTFVSARRLADANHVCKQAMKGMLHV
jgi:hypothetical protein